MLNIKYRIRDVAKDLNRNAKEIMDILAKYTEAPKNNMQTLDERELSIIFEYLTQHNQVESMESIFAEVYHEPKAPEAAPEAEASKAAAPEKPGEKAPAKAESKPQQSSQAQPAPAQKPQQPTAQRPTTRVPEKRVVDTRKGGGVNLDKYDEKLERIASSKTHQMDAGREKFRSEGVV